MTKTTFFVSFFAITGLTCFYFFAYTDNAFVSGNSTAERARYESEPAPRPAHVPMENVESPPVENMDLSPQEKLRELLKAPFSPEKSIQVRELLLKSNKGDIYSLAQIISNAILPPSYYLELNIFALETWANFSPVDALTFSYQNLERGIKHQGVQAILIAACKTAEDIESCLQAIPASTEIDEALVSIADRKSAIEERPQDAITWARGINDESTRLELIDEIANAWTTFDPGAALNWSIDNDDLDIALRAMAILAETDPWQAQKIIFDIPNAKAQVREGLLQTLINTQATFNRYENIVSILNSIPKPKSREKYYYGFIEQWSLTNPAEAANNVSALPEGSNRDYLLSTALKYWGEQSPFEALEFVTTVKNENLRKKVLTATMNSWSRKDINAAMNWAGQQPPSMTMDKSLARIGLELINGETPKALLIEWINNINDEDLRLSLLEKAEHHQQMQPEVE